MVPPRSRDRTYPLGEALFRFAPARLKSDLDRVRSLRPRRSRPERSKSPPDEVQAFKMVLDGLSEIAEEHGIQSEPVWRMQEWLVKQLGAERMEAVGLMMKPDKSRGQQPIPSFIFRGRPKINWRQSSVENFEQQFVGVEVRRASVRQSLPSEVATLAPRRPGRRRVDGPLRSIVKEVGDSGRFVDKSQKERVDIVRELARKRYSTLFPKPTQPSETKIVEALRAEGYAS